MRRYIRVTRNLVVYHWHDPSRHRYSGYRIFCAVCGHDAYAPTHEAAMDRAQTMAFDHIPYSPDGNLSCRNWGVGW